MAVSGEEVLNTLADLVANRSGGMYGSSASEMRNTKSSDSDEQIKALRKLTKVLEKTSKAEFHSKEEFDKHLKNLSKLANSAGASLEELGIKAAQKMDYATGSVVHFIEEQERVTEDLIEKTEDLADAFDDAEEETRKHTAGVSKTREQVAKFGNAIKNVTGQFFKYAEQEQRFAQQTATADAGWIKGITDMGMSQLEYMKLLKETRIEGLAAATAGVNFKKSLIESQDSLKSLTTNYEEAGKVSGMFHKNMARIGVSQGDLGDAVLQQTKIYKENYRALGYTAEEFANLTSELINDQGMRDVLLTLQDKERKAYVLGIQQRQAEYLTMGFTIDRAKELQKTFQALSGMDPKERMKKAAKKRAMMGAMGMGQEGAELFRLETTYRTMSAKQKLAADKRMTQIQSKAAAKFGQMSGAGAGLGQSMAMQMMAQKTGFTDVAKTFETESGKGSVIDKEQLGKTKEISATVSKILGYMSIWQAATHSALGSLGTAIIAGIGALIMGKFAASMITKIAGKIGGGGMGGAAGKMLGKMGGAAKGAFGAAKGAVSAAGAATKTIGKSALKSGIKKIPIIGALAGIGFGINRAMSGDWVGAAGEVASGVASIIPGAGTAASLGIDAGLLARDMAMADKTGAPEMAAAATPATTTAQPVDTASLLISTLQELQSYLKVVNQQNSELAASGFKTAGALEKGIRLNGFKDRTS